MSATYRAGDQYWDTTTPGAPVLYRCTTAGDKSSSVWAKVSGGSAQQFKVQSDGGDYWNCKTWDGTTLGSATVKVAKPHELRAVNGIASAAIRAVTYTYTYTLVSGEYVRGTTGSDGSASTDYITPSMKLTTSIIYAVPFATTTPSTLSSVTWLDLNVDGRAFASK